MANILAAERTGVDDDIAGMRFHRLPDSGVAGVALRARCQGQSERRRGKRLRSAMRDRHANRAFARRAGSAQRHGVAV